ncbi:MAG: type II secretion system F family protein [Anaerolineales bacterium]|nr:type II secretion system F family protein [Anaerolineales bacterium]
MIITVILIFIILGMAISLVVVGMRGPQSEDPLQSRLAEFAERGEDVNLEEIELSQPLRDRVILPMARSLGKFVLRFTPQNAFQQTTSKLEQAGNPRGLDPAIFWAGRIVAGLGLGLILLLLGLNFLLVILAMSFGFYVPELLLSSRIKRRQDEIRKAMPDALDLLTICVEAGLGFDGAMAKVNEKWNNELGLTFGWVIREIQLGKTRREALRDMAERLGLSEMTSFVAAIIQSEQLGVSMAKVLHIQADQMRIRRRQLAEEKAHQAPIKMLFPMGLLIFPSIMIVLMGPAALILISSDLGALLLNR